MRRLAGPAVVVLLVGAWFVTLRPATLGGPASYVIVAGNSMQPALTPGALVIGRRQPSYARGEVIIYRVSKGDLGAGTRVIHRVVGGSAEAGYITRGDNRQGRDRWRPKPGEIDGAKVLAIPGAGTLMMLLASPLVLGALVALLVFASADDVLLRRRRRPSTPAAGAPPVSVPAVALAPVPVAGPTVTPATVLSVPWLGEPAAPEAPLDPPAAVAPAAVEPAVTEPWAAPVHAVRRRRHVPARRRRVLATGGAVAGCVGAGLLLSRAGRARVR